MMINAISDGILQARNTSLLRRQHDENLLIKDGVAHKMQRRVMKTIQSASVSDPVHTGILIGGYRTLILRVLDKELSNAVAEKKRLDAAFDGFGDNRKWGRSGKTCGQLKAMQEEYVKHISDCIAFIETIINPVHDWWPKCPYPESIFTMTHEEYVAAVPDEDLRCRISGYMSRNGWNVASDAIFEAIKNQINGDE